MALRRTIETYDKIAARYTAHWRDRSTLKKAMTHFSALLSPGDLVLDAGCGPGFDAAALRRRGLRVVGLDRSWGMLREGQAHFPGWFVQADMRYLPFRSGFHGVWANASLLHLPRAHLAPTLRAFGRLLGGEGVLFASVKAGEGSGWTDTAYGLTSPRFYTYWRADEFDAALSEAGFRLERAWEEAGDDVTWINRLARSP